MMATKIFGGFVLICAVGPVLAQGAVFRCIDDNGRPQYTNVKSDTDGKKCTVVTREVSIVPNASAGTGGAAAAAPRPATNTAAVNPGPAGFPKVDPQTQRSRDDGRRRILEDELGQEKRSLDRAKAELAEQESTRLGGEKNYARVIERLKPYQDTVERHQRNVGALEKELSSR